MLRHTFFLVLVDEYTVFRVNCNYRRNVIKPWKKEDNTTRINIIDNMRGQFLKNENSIALAIAGSEIDGPLLFTNNEGLLKLS